MAKYKPSRFVYMTQNEHKELLLYNAGIGTNSFCKIREEDVPEVQRLLAGEAELEDIEIAPFVQGLKIKSYLIEDWKDEDAVLNAIYIDAVVGKSLSMIIVPTESCNFRCKYCYESFENAKLSQEDQEKIVRFVDRHIISYTSLRVEWFGGEPLLAMEVIEALSKRLLEVCKKHRKPYISSMTTNGYFLNADVLEQLNRCHVMSYQITLDGLKETHDKQRVLANGDGTFDRVVGNLKQISATSKFKYTCAIRVNLTMDMLESLSAFVDFFISNFGSDQRFSLMIKSVADLGGEAVKDMNGNLFGDAASLNRIYKQLLHLPTLPNLVLDGFLEPGGCLCYAGRKNSLIVDANGNIHKCTVSFSDKEEKRSLIGRFGERGNIVEDKYARSAWLCARSCQQAHTCFFAPVCLGESCAANRVLRKANSKKLPCPAEKDHIDDVLCILDKMALFPYLTKDS